MAYRHGVYTSEIPTAIVSPVLAEASLPFVVGTAPVNMTDPTCVNRPILCHSYQEAVQSFGFVPAMKENDAAKVKKFSYTLCEFMKSHFSLYAAQPVVMVNVLDPTTHKTAGVEDEISLDATTGSATISEAGVIASTVVISDDSEEDPQTYVKDVDFVVSYNENGFCVITSLKDSSGAWKMPTAEALVLAYYVADPEKVSLQDVIGGVDTTTGQYKGLELVNQVFARFRMTPGLIVCPRYSSFPSVAAVMAAKAEKISDHFSALALVDIPSGSDAVGDVTISGAVKYDDVPNVKNLNSISDPHQVACWPCVAIDTELYHMSTHLAGVMARTDAAHDDVPYVSPSNQNAQISSCRLLDGSEVWLESTNANYLNGNGIVTCLNFIGGWKIWGNRTACYPAITDVKDSFIPVRRMFSWLTSSLVQTYWQRLDLPLNRRQIETIVDSCNIMFNGWSAAEYILGGRVEFPESENPDTQLVDGIAVFHVYFTPAPPNREIDFRVEYDINYLSNLFA